MNNVEPFAVRDFEVTIYGVPFVVSAWIEPGQDGDEINPSFAPEAMIECVRVKGSLADICEHISDAVLEKMQQKLVEVFFYQ